MKSVFIIAIVAVAMIGVMVPSVFAEEIPIKLELNQNDFSYSDPIILKITPERIVPNTDFMIFVEDENGNEVQRISYENYRNMIYDSDGKFSGYALLVEYAWYDGHPYLARSDLPSQEYTAHVIYGDSIGKNSITFNYDNTKNSAIDFMMKNYNIDKFVISAEKYYEPVLVFNNKDGKGYKDFIQINVRYDYENSRGKTESGLVQYSLYDNVKKAQETFLNIVSFENNIINDSTTDPNIPENFQCTSTREGTICIQNNLIINAGYAILELVDRKGLPPPQFTPETTSVTTTPSVVVDSNKIAAFVDQTKDPQHYIDRYNNEPSYKEWFDENYPQYSSIYEAVGMEKPIVEDIPKPIVEPVVEYSPEPEYSSEPISDEVTINFQIGSQYSLYEMIRIEGEVSKIIPNTPITYQFSTDVNRFTKSYEMLSPYEPHLDQNGKFHMTIEYYECDDCTSGDVHLEFFYGQPDNHLASIKKSFYVDNKISKTSEKIQNYFPTDKYEIGTDVTFKERVPDLISPDPLASYWGSIWYMDRLNPKISISYFANGDHIPTGELQRQGNGYGCYSSTLQECQNFNLHDFECVSVTRYSASYEICENEYYQIFENYGKQEVNFGETGGFYMNKIIDNIVENPLETDPELQCGSGTIFIDGVCQIDIDSKINTDNSGGCLIATATYGSELAPQVQQLRELRDNQLLNTESGTQFMSTFNDIYYSFSPIIADYERENPYFKEAVKLAITPMISSLSLMENANSESEVLSIGISVIMLNLGMYLGIPAIVVIGIKKRSFQ